MFKVREIIIIFAASYFVRLLYIYNKSFAKYGSNVLTSNMVIRSHFETFIKLRFPRFNILELEIFAITETILMMFNIFCFNLNVLGRGLCRKKLFNYLSVK